MSVPGASQGFITFGLEPKAFNGSNWGGSQQSLEAAKQYGFNGGSPSGTGFFSHSTDAYSGANKTAYYDATVQFQMMLLSSLVTEGAGSTSTALCMRVNATKSSSTGTGSSTGAAPSSTSSHGAANVNTAGLGLVFGVVSLSAVLGLM